MDFHQSLAISSSKKLKQPNKKPPVKMKFLFVLFAIVAVVAAFPEQERERRGILAAPAVAAPWIAAPKIAPAVAIATGPKLLAAPAVVAAPALAPAWGLKGW
ncbi:hypothetical protein ANTQUA_LOCUS221 [Anthophora quadrimaculata]